MGDTTYTKTEDVGVPKDWIGTFEKLVTGNKLEGNILMVVVKGAFNRKYRPKNREERPVVSIRQE